MRVLRALGGAVLWILAAVVGLVAIILCVTVLLLPLGLPLLNLARQMFASAIRMMLPPAVAHPVKTMDKELGARSARKKAGRSVRKKAGKAADGVADKAVGKGSRNPLRRRRRLLG